VVEGMIVAPMKKTYFEQVPLEAIKNIIEENERKEKVKTGEEPRGTKKKGREAGLLNTSPANAFGEGR
jgi:hypothetical protein